MLTCCSLVSNVGIGFTKPVSEVSGKGNYTILSSHAISAHQKSNTRKYMQHRPNEHSTIYTPLRIQSCLIKATKNVFAFNSGLPSWSKTASRAAARVGEDDSIVSCTHDYF